MRSAYTQVCEKRCTENLRFLVGIMSTDPSVRVDLDRLLIVQSLQIEP